MPQPGFVHRDEDPPRTQPKRGLPPPPIWGGRAVATGFPDDDRRGWDAESARSSSGDATISPAERLLRTNFPRLVLPASTSLVHSRSHAFWTGCVETLASVPGLGFLEAKARTLRRQSCFVIDGPFDTGNSPRAILVFGSTVSEEANPILVKVPRRLHVVAGAQVSVQLDADRNLRPALHVKRADLPVATALA